VYFPILFMLLGLIFRGVAFEFRHMSEGHARWDRSFFFGSLVATFAQGVVLGTYVQGIPIAGRQFAGGSLNWATLFALATGAGLIVGYGLLGACWLVMKTEGTLKDWACRKARILAFGVAAFIGMGSLWTPFLQPQIAQRWFVWPNLLWLSPVPLITLALFVWLWREAGRQARRCAIPRGAGAVPDVLHRPGHQHLADGRALHDHALGRGVGGEGAGLSHHRHAIPAADHRHVYGLVVLGVSRQG
jgi:cytochrome d ubiquinol oxidase subunit II